MWVDLILFLWLKNVVLSTRSNGLPTEVSPKLAIFGNSLIKKKVNGLIFLEKSPVEVNSLPWFTVCYFTANAQDTQLTVDRDQHE